MHFENEIEISLQVNELNVNNALEKYSRSGREEATRPTPTAEVRESMICRSSSRMKRKY